MKDKSDVGTAWDDVFTEDSYKISVKELTPIKRSFHVKFVDKYTPKGGKILEAGCGSAKFSLTFALKGYDATAMDYSSHIVRIVTKLSAAIRKGHKRMKFKIVKGNIEKMPFKDGTFDSVFNEGVVEHWLVRKQRIAVMREMARVTKKGGHVIILVPNGHHPLFDYWDRKGLMSFKLAPPMTVYNAKKLRADVEAAGLEVLETDGINPWNSFGHYPYRPLLLAPAYFLNRMHLLPRRTREKWGLDLIVIGRKT